MKIYKLEHEPLPKMFLSTDELVLGAGGDYQQIPIVGDVSERLKKIAELQDQLKKFERQCYAFIDREKLRKMQEPLIKRIEELEGKNGE